MQNLDRVIALYQEGRMSLFEAAQELDLHPSEFTDLMVQKRDVIPIVIRPQL